MDPIVINPNRIDLDEAYLQMAEIWAQRSKANRAQVGALIVNNRQIISDGYNGMPVGSTDDVCEVWKDGAMVTKPAVLHAESNAITKLAASHGAPATGSTMYVTMSPCFECSKLIIQAGIKRVVYRQQYRVTEGLDLLREFNVEVIQKDRE